MAAYDALVDAGVTGVYDGRGRGGVQPETTIEPWRQAALRDVVDDALVAAGVPEMLSEIERLDRAVRGLRRGIEMAGRYEFDASVCGARKVLKLTADQLVEVVEGYANAE